MGKIEVPPSLLKRCIRWRWNGDEGYCSITDRSCSGPLGWCTTRVNEMRIQEYLEQKSW